MYGHVGGPWWAGWGRDAEGPPCHQLRGVQLTFLSRAISHSCRELSSIKYYGALTVGQGLGEALAYSDK